MIPAEVANWIVALPLFGTSAICALFTLEMTSSEMRAKTTASRWRYLLTNGSFYLGQFFGWLGAFNLIIGFFLLIDPHGLVPMWFAFLVWVKMIFIVLAWWFLFFTVDKTGD